MNRPMPVQVTKPGFPMTDGPDGDFDRLRVDVTLFSREDAANLVTPPTERPRR